MYDFETCATDFGGMNGMNSLWFCPPTESAGFVEEPRVGCLATQQA